MRWNDLQANTTLAVWHQVANERCHSSLLAARRLEGCQTAAENQSRTLTRSTGVQWHMHACLTSNFTS